MQRECAVLYRDAAGIHKEYRLAIPATASCIGDLIEHVRATYADIPAGSQLFAKRGCEPCTAQEVVGHHVVVTTMDVVARESPVGQPVPVRVVPAPYMLRQETKDMTLVDKLCELLDNSLSAVAGVQTPTILLKFLDSRPDSEALLVLEDNGHGMSREVLEKALITACTFSTEHRLQRTELPVRLDQYLDCHFNRFGRGLNVVFGIGNTLVIDSRHPGTGQGHRLQASYPEWVEAFERGQHDNTFKCMSCELAPATERLEQGCTSITVSDLLPDVLATLRQPGNLQLIAAEIRSLYHFHLEGVGSSSRHQVLWERLPACVRARPPSRLPPPSGASAPGSLPGSAASPGVRVGAREGPASPAGGRRAARVSRLCLEVFGFQLGRTSSAVDQNLYRSEKLHELVAAATAVHDNHASLLPFVLPLRWVPRRHGTSVVGPPHAACVGAPAPAPAPAPATEYVDMLDPDLLYKEIALAVKQHLASSNAPQRATRQAAASPRNRRTASSPGNATSPTTKGRGRGVPPPPTAAAQAAAAAADTHQGRGARVGPAPNGTQPGAPPLGNPQANQSAQRAGRASSRLTGSGNAGAGAGPSRAPGRGAAAAAATGGAGGRGTNTRARARGRGRAQSASGRETAARGGAEAGLGGSDSDDVMELTEEEAEVIRQAQARQAALEFRDPNKEANMPDFVDFLLLLYYFPYKDGVPTKPAPRLGLLPLWSGRLMPRDFFVDDLPNLVKAARMLGLKQQKVSAPRLGEERLAGLLFVSPDSGVEQHKVKLAGAAQEALRKLGNHIIDGQDQAAAGAAVTLDSIDSNEGDLYAYDLGDGKFVKDTKGDWAARLLWQHFYDNWRPTDEDLVLDRIDVERCGEGVLYGTRVTCSRGSSMDPIESGELVYLHAPTSGKTKSLQEVVMKDMPPSCKPAHNFYRIKEFSQLGDQTIQVSLAPWRPDWAEEERQVRQEPIHRIGPLGCKKEDRQGSKERLTSAWTAMCPHHLLFLPRDKAAVAGLRASALSSELTPGHNVDEITLAIVNEDDKMLKRGGAQAVDHFQVQYFTFKAELRCQTAANNPVWSQAKAEVDNVSYRVRVFGFKTSCQTVGDYELRIFPMDTQGWMRPGSPAHHPAGISWAFKVTPNQGSVTLTARWLTPAAAAGTSAGHQAAGAKPELRLGSSLPDLELTMAMGGYPKPFPAHITTDVKQLLLALSFRVSCTAKVPALGQADQTPSQDSAAGKRKQAGKQYDGCETVRCNPFLVKLQPKRQPRARVRQANNGVGLVVSGLIPPPTWLDVRVPVVKRAARAEVQLQVEYLGEQQEVHESGPLELSLLSGWPASVQAEEQLEYSKGQLLEEQQLALKDAEVLGSVRPFWNEDAQVAKGRRLVWKLELEGVEDKLRTASCTLEVDEWGMATLPAHRFLVTSPMGEVARVTATLVPGSRPSIPTLRHVFTIEVTRHHFTFKHGAVQATEALASNRVGSAAAGVSEEAVVRSTGVVAGHQLDLLDRVEELAQGSRPPLQVALWDNLEQKDVRLGVESRRADLILRPDGRVYRGQHARKKLLEDLANCGSQRFYETVLTVHPGATQVSGISLQFCQFKDDHVDDSFAAPFYVAYSTADGGLQPAYPNPLGPRQLGLLPTQAEYKLPPLELAPVQAMWAAGQLSVPLRVMDADSQGGRLVWRREYGRFWLRQAPRPASLRALPLDPQGPTLALDNLSGGHALATPSGQLRRFRVWRAASVRKDCSEPAGALLDPIFCLVRPRAAHGAEGLCLEDWKAVDLVGRGAAAPAPAAGAGGSRRAEVSTVSLSWWHDCVEEQGPLELVCNVPFKVPRMAAQSCAGRPQCLLLRQGPPSTCRPVLLLVSVRPGHYPVRLLPLLSSQHWGGLGTLDSLDLTSLHWAEQGAAAVAAAGCGAAGEAGGAGVGAAGPGLVVEGAPRTAAWRVHLSNDEELPGLPGLGLVALGPDGRPVGEAQRSTLGPVKVVWEQWVPSTGPAAEWASDSLEFPSGPGSWQQAQPHPHLQEGQGQQARHPSGQPAAAARPLPSFGVGGQAAAVTQRGRPGAGRVTSLQVDWLTQSSEGEGPEHPPGQVLCSQLQAGQLQAPSRQGWWRLAFTCPALPGLGSCYVGPIQVLAGPPQQLQATLVEGHTAGLARAPADVAGHQVLALAPDTVQVVTPAALSVPPSPTSLALPAVQLAALDAWGNAVSLPPGVQLRLVLRCCSPDNSSTAGPAAAPGADATAGRRGQEWVLHCTDLSPAAGSHTEGAAHAPTPARSPVQALALPSLSLHDIQQKMQLDVGGGGGGDGGGGGQLQMGSTYWVYACLWVPAAPSPIHRPGHSLLARGLLGPSPSDLSSLQRHQEQQQQEPGGQGWAAEGVWGEMDSPAAQRRSSGKARRQDGAAGTPHTPGPPAAAAARPEPQLASPPTRLYPPSLLQPSPNTQPWLSDSDCGRQSAHGAAAGEALEPAALHILNTPQPPAQGIFPAPPSPDKAPPLSLNLLLLRFLLASGQQADLQRRRMELFEQLAQARQPLEQQQAAAQQMLDKLNHLRAQQATFNKPLPAPVPCTIASCEAEQNKLWAQLEHAPSVVMRAAAAAGTQGGEAADLWQQALLLCPRNGDPQRDNTMDKRAIRDWTAAVQELQQGLVQGAGLAPAVLGPVQMLLACERRDVAACLSGYLRSSLECWVTCSEEGQRALDRQRKEESLMVYLPEVHRICYKAKDPVDNTSAQGWLKGLCPQPEVDTVLEAQGAASGFIGYAANLVYLPPGLARCKVAVQRPRRQPAELLTLRQSLVYVLFGSLMVFETDAHAQHFVTAVREVGQGELLPHTRLITLDGRTINMQAGRKSKPRPYHGVCMSGLAAEHQEGQDKRVKALMNQLDTLHEWRQLLQSTAAATTALSEQEKVVQAAQADSSHLLARLELELKQVEAELLRMQPANGIDSDTLGGPAAGDACGPEVGMGRGGVGSGAAGQPGCTGQPSSGPRPAQALSGRKRVAGAADPRRQQNPTRSQTGNIGPSAQPRPDPGPSNGTSAAQEAQALLQHLFSAGGQGPAVQDGLPHRSGRRASNR